MGDEKPEAGKRAFRLGSTERKTGGVFESLQGRIEGIRKSTGDNACAQGNPVQDEGEADRESYFLSAFL